MTKKDLKFRYYNGESANDCPFKDDKFASECWLREAMIWNLSSDKDIQHTENLIEKCPELGLAGTKEEQVTLYLVATVSEDIDDRFIELYTKRPVLPRLPPETPPLSNVKALALYFYVCGCISNKTGSIKWDDIALSALSGRL